MHEILCLNLELFLLIKIYINLLPLLKINYNEI